MLSKLKALVQEILKENIFCIRPKMFSMSISSTFPNTLSI